MADKRISELQEATAIDDASLFVTEQQEQAMRVSGAVLKEYARAAAAAEAAAAGTAANEAQAAQHAIEDMTASAVAAAAPYVTKTVAQTGVVNLEFGLVPGPAGPAGPKGDTGKGLVILGRYDTIAALSAGVPAPDVGDAYSVGTAAPYDVCIWDGAQWVNNGKLQGADGQDGVTFTPSVSANGVLTWTNDGSLENPAAVSIRGPAGAAGAAGPNEVSASTQTSYTKILKGNGSKVTQAVAGTDYIAPVSGTAGNVVVFGAGGALADSGKTIGETGGSGGWKVVCKSLPMNSTNSIPSGTNYAISPGISLSGNRVIEFELEVFGLTQGSVLNALIVNSSSEQIGFLAAASSENSSAGHMRSRCWIHTGNQRSIAYYEDKKSNTVQTQSVSYTSGQSEIVKVTFSSTGTNAFLALVVRYRIWEDPGV